MIIFLEIFTVVPGENATGYTWFDAQDKCRTHKGLIVSPVKTSKLIWSTYYHRVSQWIGKYGK